MHPHVHLSKHFGSLLLCIIACLTVFGIRGTVSSTPKAYAAQVSTDPLVIISVDRTQKSSCTETFQANIGTPLQVTKHIPCVPGTIMSDITVRRSQAIAQHEAYVLLPSASASPAVRQQTLQQIQRLHQSKQTLLQSRMSHYSLPTTACGGDGTASLTWNLDGGTFFASISFYRSTDCTTAYFNSSQLNTNVALFDDAYWSYDLYAGYGYGVPGCPDVKAVGHRFHLVSQAAPIHNYYYENWLYPDAACQQNYDYTWDNIGPIN